MNITSRTATIKIGEPNDEAVLVFDQLRDNAKAKINYLLTKAKSAQDNLEAAALVNEYRETVLKLCISVENLFEDGKPITADQVQRAALYTDTVDLILSAYFTALNPVEASEKNESPAE